MNTKWQLGEAEHTILEQPEPPAEGPRPKWEKPVLDSPEQEKPCDEDRLDEIAELPVELPGFFPGQLWRVRGFCLKSAQTLSPRHTAPTSALTHAAEAAAAAGNFNYLLIYCTAKALGRNISSAFQSI